MILAGYSIISASGKELKLNTQDVTPIHHHIGTILTTLRHDLQAILGAFVDYASEGDLKRRLRARGLDVG